MTEVVATYESRRSAGVFYEITKSKKGTFWCRCRGWQWYRKCWHMTEFLGSSSLDSRELDCHAQGMASKPAKPKPKALDGFTTGLWTSLAIKSVRMGWLPGLLEAEKRLNKSAIHMAVLVQVFEDLWPAYEEIPEVMAELKARNWPALLARDTHHGRGMSHLYKEERCLRVYYSQEPRKPRLYEMCKQYGVPFLGWRGTFEFAHYVEVQDEVGDFAPATKRTVDMTPWKGMPPAIADMHTDEGRKLAPLGLHILASGGKWKGSYLTILCGHPEGHNWLCRVISEGGWEAARKLVHDEEPLEPTAPRLGIESEQTMFP
jgi:hypothetical protein